MPLHIFTSFSSFSNVECKVRRALEDAIVSIGAYLDQIQTVHLHRCARLKWIPTRKNLDPPRFSSSTMNTSTTATTSDPEAPRMSNYCKRLSRSSSVGWRPFRMQRSNRSGALCKCVSANAHSTQSSSHYPLTTLIANIPICSGTEKLGGSLSLSGGHIESRPATRNDSRQRRNV